MPVIKGLKPDFSYKNAAGNWQPATNHRPLDGYFISQDTRPNTAVDPPFRPGGGGEGLGVRGGSTIKTPSSAPITPKMYKSAISKTQNPKDKYRCM
jgi:hypothetical protein